MRARIRPLPSLAAGLFLLVPAAVPAAPATHVVVIDKMRFGAMPNKLTVGDRIVWENRDVVRHTATARDKSFNLDLPARTKGSILVRKAGAIPVYCIYHPAMKATLKVGK